MLQTLGLHTPTNLLQYAKSIFVFLLRAEGCEVARIDKPHFGDFEPLHVLSRSMREHCIYERRTLAVQFVRLFRVAKLPRDLSFDRQISRHEIEFVRNMSIRVDGLIDG